MRHLYILLPLRWKRSNVTNVMLWRILEVEINCPYSIRVLEMLSLIVRLLAILDYYTGKESQLCCLGWVTKGDISVVGSNILLILFPSPPLCNKFARFTPSTLQKSHFTPFLPQKRPRSPH